MKIILHIGCEKTGTTTLQRFMRLNRRALAAEGICYPKSAGKDSHTKLAAAAMSDERIDVYLRRIYGIRTRLDLEEFRDQLKSALHSELEGFGRVILSSEHCSSALLSDEEVARLRDMLNEFSSDIGIVVYLRRQDDFLASTYSTEIRLGAVHKLQIPGSQIIQERYNYQLLLNRWQSCFDDITVRIYDRKRLVQGNIIDDFLGILGVAPDRGFECPADENTALGRDQVEFMRGLNKYLPLMSGKDFFGPRGNIGQLIDKVPQSGGKNGLDRDDAQRFMAMFNHSNGAVADEYFGRRELSGDPLFGNWQPMPCDVGPHVLTLEAAARISAQLLKERSLSEGVNFEVDRYLELFAQTWRLSSPEPQHSEPGVKRFRCRAGSILSSLLRRRSANA